MRSLFFCKKNLRMSKKSSNFAAQNCLKQQNIQNKQHEKNSFLHGSSGTDDAGTCAVL
jgi:hypothetical protein